MVVHPVPRHDHIRAVFEIDAIGLAVQLVARQHRRVVRRLQVDARVGVAEDRAVRDRQPVAVRRTRGIDAVVAPRDLQVIQRHVVRTGHDDHMTAGRRVPPVQARHVRGRALDPHARVLAVEDHIGTRAYVPVSTWITSPGSRSYAANNAARFAIGAVGLLPL